MCKQSFKPELQSVSKIQNFAKEYLKKQKIHGEKIFGIIDLIIEELVVNIVNYGFKDVSKGIIGIEVHTSEGKINLKISDNGIPFNPLNIPAPDINLPLKDRKIGGLGIFFVKQKSRHCSYSYKNGINELSITIDYTRPFIKKY